MKEIPHIVRERGGSFANWCVNFRSMQNDTCEAGIAYDSVREEREFTYSYSHNGAPMKGHVTYPCFKHEAGIAKKCDKCRFPNETEIKEHEEMVAGHMKKMALALEAIQPIRKAQKGKDWSGVIECPVCKGRLHVSHAAYNGHVHAACETKDCVAWME